MTLRTSAVALLLALPAGAADVDASVRAVVLCWPVIDPLARYHYAKKLKESIAEYRKLGKAGDVEKIEGELRIVEEYLPAGLSEAESRELVRAVVSELGATSMKDMGRVMKEVQTRAQGRGDGKLLSDLVRTSLS